jgi:spoIIIJ-associated protein
MKEDAKKILSDLLDLMCIDDFEVQVNDLDDGGIRININNLSDRDTALLIGRQGDNLHALQFVLRTLVRKMKELENREERMVALDVMNYKRRQVDNLTILAKKMAQEAKDFNKEIELRPMNAFERRIIHVALKDDDFVQTESVDEGENRRVVIKILRTQIDI